MCFEIYYISNTSRKIENAKTGNPLQNYQMSNNKNVDFIEITGHDLTAFDIAGMMLTKSMGTVPDIDYDT